MNPWFGGFHQVQNTPFDQQIFGPFHGFPFNQVPIHQGPFPYGGNPFQQFPFHQAQQFQSQIPQFPFQSLLPQHQSQQVTPSQQNTQQQLPGQFTPPDPFAGFKTKDGDIDFTKIGNSINQVMGIANQIGPLMKTFGIGR
ncbi:YppG family protein [Anaerobacillus sp. MEB173]|uniref:YppG family protein n=1 Tax=Anaerobacillus sp. MEB173 TaxID=3383345 RepID=UPI003F9343F9